MNLNWIQEFIILADSGSYSKAAAALGISQPLLTKHIKNLEDELGCSLFDRSTRMVSLNRFGTLYYSYANRIVSASMEFQAAVCDLTNQTDTSFCIAIPYAISYYHIPELISSFSSTYQIVPQIIETNAAGVISLLNQNKCTFGFVRESGPFYEDTFEHDLFLEDRLAAILPLEHPLASASSVQVGQLMTENLLMLPEVSMTTKLFLEACSQAGRIPQIHSVISRSETILNMVANHLGVSFLMQTMASMNSSRVAVVPVNPPMTSSIFLLYNKNFRLNTLGIAFLEYVKQHKQGVTLRNGD